ncbi:hypothetical protein FXO37_24418 [Capsicum annuum]|nr:hypothetical protein FXO37_24418 [Capsicum annuum]
MLESMKSKVYQQKTMYCCAGFLLAFQCWFYECCPCADGHLADRVGDGVPRILNRFIKYRPTYKEVKSAFFDIRQEQVVLRNITPTVIEKTILQLPDFKPVDVVVHSVDLPSTSKQECSQSSSDNKLALLRSDVKMLTEKVDSIESDNSNEKDDETPNVGGTGDDQVNDPPNVGHQNYVVPEVDHISDNLMDDVGKITDSVGGDVFGHLVDDVGEKVNFVGDCVVGHVAVDSAAETFKDGAWKKISNFNFLKFTQRSGENKDIGEGRNSQVDSNWSNFTDSEVSKFTQPFCDQKIQKEGDVAVLSQNELDWVDVTASDNVKGIEENMVVASVMLDETPFIPRRIRKPAAVRESPFLSKFNFGCGKVEGQSFKRVDNMQPSNHILSIKHPFVMSITEQIDDMKVILQFNRDCGVFVAAFAEYLLDGLEISNHLDDIDIIRIWYGVLQWDFGKKKQKQCAVSEDESTGRLLKKKDGVQQI